MAWPESVDVVLDAQALASEYNVLRDDVINRPRELWAPAISASDGAAMGQDGFFNVALLIAIGMRGYTAPIKIPSDYASIITAEMIVMPEATQAAANYDIASEYGGDGEDKDNHAESDAATTYNATQNQRLSIDISGILTVLAAGDTVAFRLEQGANGHNVTLIGVRLRINCVE